MSVAIVTVYTTFFPNLSSGFSLIPEHQSSDPETSQKLTTKIPFGSQVFSHPETEVNTIQYITNPNNALLKGKFFKITVDVHGLIPPNFCNLMTRQKYTMFHTQEYKSYITPKNLSWITPIIILFQYPIWTENNHPEDQDSPLWKEGPIVMTIETDRHIFFFEIIPIAFKSKNLASIGEHI